MSLGHTTPSPEPPPTPPAHGLSRRVLTAVVAVLLLIGALLGGTLSLALRHTPALVSVTPVGDRVSAAAASQIPGGFGRPGGSGAQIHVPPVEVAIPAIGVRSRLIGLRLGNDGTLQVPTDYGIAGWYSDGPAPGDPGLPAVIVGHVDSKAGPGVFYRLPELRIGDAVLMRGADGSDLKFVVYQSTSYPKDRFPSETVYRAHASPELRLITCTGTFNKASGHYTDNRVIYARLSAPHKS